MKTVRQLAVSCLLMWCFVGSLMAQNDPLYVIKKRTDVGTNEDHYLAHVKQGSNWVLQDVTSFSPDCLWHSGNTIDNTGVNHNYYFHDGTNYRFLKAPLEAQGAISISDTLPPAQLLRNVEQDYYFYDWDWDNKPIDGAGVSRGLQHTGIPQSACTNPPYNYSWGSGECWEVYWVEYYATGNTWKLSSASSYNMTTNSARFRYVTVTPHEMEVTNVTSGQLADLADFTLETQGSSHALSVTAGTYSYSYIPAYTTYVFAGGTHNYYNNTDNGASTPSETSGSGTPSSYQWTVTGPGAEFLSFNSSSSVTTATGASQTLYYYQPNNTGHKTATLTLTVSYSNGVTQVRTATVTVKTPCQNPAQAEAPVVNYDYVTVSWINTADEYTLSWKKDTESTWKDTTLTNVTSYTFRGLAYDTKYNYKVKASCTPSTPSPTVYSFTTKKEPDLIVYGSIFGGGRMADVTGNPEVVVINCDSVGAVFGGNDIAGTVSGGNGSKIVLGVNVGDTYSVYNNDTASIKVRVHDVYGGGNGYYSYGTTNFAAATTPTVTINGKAHVYTVSQTPTSVWQNPTQGDSTLTLPSITKTAITMVNDKVKVDSIFGGAKNAYLTTNSGNGSSVTISNGTALAVYGGNNIGGGQGYGKHYVKVTGTTTKLEGSIANTATTGYGRDFGIRYLFGGGNKVAGSTTDVQIEGGQLDTIFAGGNAADVFAANMTVNCDLDHTYSSAIASHTATTIESIDADYTWDGYTGIYNVRTLFGGNNEASMAKVPHINLTSGSVGTVYGGGNAGDMLARDSLDGNNNVLVLGGNNVKYSTHVELNSANMLVDYLYGGCQISNVDYSTWVEIKNGHVGYVYGGCNVSGDVGSTKLNPTATGPKSLAYQAVYGGTYVHATGGIVYKNLFAGSNGFYHCNDGISYVASSIVYGDPENKYIGMRIPTHNETHALIGTGATIKGNVYAGGNLAPVGFTNTTVGNPTVGYKPYPTFVGLSSVQMSGGTVNGDVYGGGNMAAIFGSNEVNVTGGAIGGALYGGNDRLGMVAQITNRILPPEYDVASDGNTPLANIRTYVGVSGRPDINTIYGGGNGAYDYQHGDIQYCNPDDQPIQSHTFVDIGIDGYKLNPTTQGGHINTVYGGGNGVSVTGSVTVFLNVKGENGGLPEDYDHVGTIFGGNNMGDLTIVPNIVLLNGNVNTVYGGCNQGAMLGDTTITAQNGATYDHLGSLVRLLNKYTVVNTSVSPNTTHTTTPTAKVTGAVYGGCRMNGVGNNSKVRNSLVLVEGGTHTASMFGGSDIGGDVSGTSRVIVDGGGTGNIYGGGNGNYYYVGNKAYKFDDHTVLVDSLKTGTISAPVCAVSQVDVRKGSVGIDASHTADIFGGGLGAATSTTGNVTVTIGTDTASAVAYTPLIYGDIYGGSALGTVNTNSSNLTKIDFLNGTLHGNLYGGGLGRKASTGVDPIEAKVKGQVLVNISSSTQAANKCFIDLRDADVFGCNNANGSPQDDVTVNVYQTAHNFPDYPTGEQYNVSYTGNEPHYSIRQVFGGGNEANYAPLQTSNKTTVNVIGCNNTVGRVFGGGNAADAYAVATNVYGGRFHQVFGGGNGQGSPANIGLGGASLYVSGGRILQLFGGNNLQGGITGPLTVNVTNAGSCTVDEEITEFFGGSNKAPIGTTANPVALTTTIDCSNPPVNIETVYGGSNLATITGDVTVNIRGGNYTDVFAGSKGEASGTAADINGTTTLNLYGGKITNAFGGSNKNGNITGAIQVNVIDAETTNCPLDVANVFGASNETAYTPTNASLISPVVNVNHIAQTDGIKGNVYGGGNKAAVTANPQVNINPASGQRAYVYGNVYGGGNEAGITGNPVVNMYNGTVRSGIYGGCNTNGTVDGNINVNIYNGTLGVSGTPMVEGIFGGGKGNATQTTGNVTVTIGDGTTPTIYADVYGGSAFGQVGAGGKLAKVDFKNGTINGTLYGGGKGDSSNAAEVTGDAQLAITGNVTNGVYGGCNVNGIVKGDATVDITGAVTIGDQSNANRGIVYGGGLGENTKVKGDVAVTINNASANVWGDVYGGSAKGLVNCNETGTGANTGSKTDVTFTTGTIHGNLYGGGHGLDNKSANVYGPVTVTVGGGTVGSVFGGNNLKGAPTDAIVLNVTAGTMDSIFGGGNQAAYTAPWATENVSRANYPALNISGGEVKYKVVGGGNAAGITGNPAVTISNGTFCTSTDLSKVGIYGGCNQTGEVDGDIVLTLTGDATHPTTIGTQTGMNTKTPVNIFGGGYGAGTNTTGSVTVNYGAISTTASDYPMLYGDLYGGSALGHVNSDGSDSTNVNVLNGSFKYFEETINQQEYQYGGSIYGGGLGNAGNAATVKGRVHVNIGAGEIIPSVLGGDSLRLLGNADLYHCNVYGCNNVSGTPLDDVYVDVFKTKQTAATSLDGTDYAIRNVFGGGNLANYNPPGTNTNTEGHKTHVYIHGCDNTIEFAYGGGNAAAAVGSIILFDGGRFDEVFGGGNGLIQAANIGAGGVCIQGFGGHVNYMTEGSNKQGSNSGYPHAQYVLYTNGNYPPGHLYCGDLFVDSYFFGTNQAEYIGDLNNTITCAQASDFHFKYVYAGSRFAVIYGDVSLTVQGGEIQNVFGGSRGYENSPFAADIRKYPTDSLLTVHANDGYYSQALLDTLTAHPERKGTGGNVNLIIEGGTIGNVYGGCDRNGNVEGKITVTVKEVNSSCGLFVGDVYGASNLTPYTPNNSKLASPEVNILKGTLGGEAEFTMGSGSHTETLNFAGNVFGGGNKGDITSFPKVYIGDATNTSNKATVKGNVFGGGNEADVTGNTDVILQGNAEVKTNVYGGGYKGDVVGSSNVTIVPTQNP